MSGLLLSADEFTRAREAMRGGEVTSELYAFLGRLVAVAQATRALAPAPVPLKTSLATNRRSSRRPNRFSIPP